MDCNVPKPRVKGVGDACNREMGETSAGTRLSEMANKISSLIPGRHLHGGPDLPVHPYKANSRTEPNLPDHYKSVACIYVGEENPHPQTLPFFTLFSLWTSCSFLVCFGILHIQCASGCKSFYNVKVFLLLTCCLCWVKP